MAQNLPKWYVVRDGNKWKVVYEGRILPQEYLTEDDAESNAKKMVLLDSNQPDQAQLLLF